MQDQKTQQFAKFYIKDIKIKIHKDHSKKNSFDALNVTTAN
tara:strand:+ start:496 stop:618 length:123 start_codon:yes stop_codon:yes gene_type:complete